MPLSSVIGASSILRPGVCTSTTRPASPFEGQTIYETDTDRLATWDGSAWVAYVRQTAGKVLQVVSTTKTDTFVSSSVAPASVTDITGLSATITPSSTSSKILAFYSVYGCIEVGGQRQIFSASLYRGSTAIGVGDTAGSRTSVSGQNGQIGILDGFGLVSGMHLDSPSTTSATTYKMSAVALSYGSSNMVLYVNRTFPDTNNSFWPRTASNITVMEISG